MDNIFLNLVNISITASWIVLAVVILRFALKKAPKWIRCLLWGIVGLRLIMPFSLESVFSLIPSTETINTTTYEGRPNIQTGVQIVDKQVNEYIGTHYYEGSTAPTNNFDSIMTVISIIWLVGIVLMIVYSTFSYVRLRRKVDASLLFRDNIFYCDSIDSPFILGIITPRIYLPSDISPIQMNYVIEHETAHLKRKDHWWKPLGFVLLTVYWFTPVMWVAYVLLCRDIELACDEKAIKDFENGDKKGYSEALVACSVRRRMVMACPLAFGEVGVKDRIKSVLSYKKPAFWIIIIAVIACIAVAVGFLTDPIADIENDERFKVFLDIQIANNNRSSDSDSNYCSFDYVILGTDKGGDNITVYMQVLYQEYSYDNGLKTEYGSYSPTVIYAKKVNDYYELTEYWTPRDGTYYDDDINEKFPLYLRSKAFDKDKYIEELTANCEKKATKFFSATVYNSMYDISCQSGSLFFYENATNEHNNPVISSYNAFTETEMADILTVLGELNWTDDGTTDRLQFNYDGCIYHNGWLYFGYEQKVIYYDHYFCTMPDGIAQKLKAKQASAKPYDSTDTQTDMSISDLQEKYRDYFGLDTSDGLTVYIWQMAENSYSCVLLSGTSIPYTYKYLLEFPTTTMEEMRAIVSSYGLPQSKIIITPTVMPHSSYAYNINDQYIAKLEALFWYGEVPVTGNNETSVNTPMQEFTAQITDADSLYMTLEEIVTQEKVEYGEQYTVNVNGLSTPVKLVMQGDSELVSIIAYGYTVETGSEGIYLYGNINTKLYQYGDAVILSRDYYDVGNTWILTPDGCISVYPENGTSVTLDVDENGELRYTRLAEKFNADVQQVYTAPIYLATSRDDFYREEGIAAIQNGQLVLYPEKTYTISDCFDLDEIFEYANENGEYTEYDSVDELLEANNSAE